MAGRIHEMKAVLDPWLETEPDPELREAVLRKLMWISESIDEIFAWSAIPGVHPLKRTIEVDEGVLITLVLTNPVRGARLISIEYLSGFEPDPA